MGWGKSVLESAKGTTATQQPQKCRLSFPPSSVFPARRDLRQPHSVRTSLAKNGCRRLRWRSVGTFCTQVTNVRSRVFSAMGSSVSTWGYLPTGAVRAWADLGGPDQDWHERGHRYPGSAWAFPADSDRTLVVPHPRSLFLLWVWSVCWWCQQWVLKECLYMPAPLFMYRELYYTSTMGKVRNDSNIHQYWND